jgi:hypothetical protein
MVFSGKEFIHHLEEGSRRIAFTRTFDKQEWSGCVVNME